MSRTVWCLTALAALAVGCEYSAAPPPQPVATGEQATFDTADEDATSGTGAAADSPAEDADDAAEAAAPAGASDADDVAEAPAEGDDQTDDGGTVDEPGDAGATEVAEDEDSAEGEGDAEEGGTELTADELIEKAQGAAESGEIDAAIGHLRDAVKTDPEHRLARLYLAYFLQGQAMIRLEEADDDEQKAPAYALLAEAGDHAQKLTEGGAKLDDTERRVVPDVLYNAACAKALSGKPDEAFETIKLALDAGYTDFGKLETDEDLASVRENPEFASLLAEYRVKALESAQEHARELLAENEPFPFDFTLPGLDERPLKLADFKGQVVIVDIWGTWCPPCRMEVPHFIALRDKYHEQGLEVIGINYEGSEGEEAKTAIQEFSDEVGINYPLVIGDQETQDQVPNLEGYPTTLFLDRAGAVRLKVVGYHDLMALEGIVLTLLAEPALETPAEEPAEAATETPAEDPAEAPAEEPAEDTTEAPAEPSEG